MVPMREMQSLQTQGTAMDMAQQFLLLLGVSLRPFLWSTLQFLNRPFLYQKVGEPQSLLMNKASTLSNNPH
jgi:hypothetical protein